MTSVDRRSALARLVGALSGLLGAVLITPSVLYLLDPLRRLRGARGGAPALPVAFLRDVPDLDAGEKTAPLRATVIAKDQRDAWNRLETVKLGSVWLYRRGDRLSCFSTTCPHAGCAIDYDEKRHAFLCPCHGSSFSLDGERRDGPSPRDMDRLEAEVKDELVMCRFQRFRLAVSKKEAV